jgi:hypothetical protein
MFEPDDRMSEWRLLGRNRYAVWLRMPWGTVESAEVLVASQRGWADHREASDPHWAPYEVGPAILAIRLRGTLLVPDDSTEQEPEGKMEHCVVACD